jgi:hypothetical protein
VRCVALVVGVVGDGGEHLGAVLQVDEGLLAAFGIGVDGVEGLGEDREQLVADRVQPLWAIEGDAGDAGMGVIQEDGLAHGESHDRAPTTLWSTGPRINVGPSDRSGRCEPRSDSYSP